MMIKNKLIFLKKPEIIARLNNFIWIFPYLSGLLIIGGLSNPIITVGMHQGFDVEIWIFGLKVDYNHFMDLPVTMIIGGLIITIIFCISIPFLIVPSINFAFSKEKLNYNCKYWLFGSILIILGLIIYFIQDYITLINNIVNLNRNNPYQVETTFTIILYFLGAFLGISGYFLSRFIKVSHIELKKN